MQGTDAIIFCRVLAKGAQYIGIDYSEQSVAAARRALEEMSTELTRIIHQEIS